MRDKTPIDVPGDLLKSAPWSQWDVYEKLDAPRNGSAYRQVGRLSQKGWALALAYDEYEDMTLVLTSDGMFWTVVVPPEVVVLYEE